MATTQGKLVITGMFAKIAAQMKGKGGAASGMDMSTMSGMMDMLGSFTLLRLTGMMGTMNINFTKEQLLDLNAKLNKIKAPMK